MRQCFLRLLQDIKSINGRAIYGVFLLSLMACASTLPNSQNVMDLASYDLNCATHMLSMDARSTNTDVLIEGCQKQANYQYQPKIGWVKIDHPESFEKNVFKQAISAQKKNFARCYQQHATKYEKLVPASSVLTKFVIGQSGRVQQAVVAESSVENLKIEECIIERLLSMEFPNQKTPTTVSHRFIFRSRNQN